MQAAGAAFPTSTNHEPAGDRSSAGLRFVAGETSLLIVGASARAAAHSAIRAGIQPSCIDLFADSDLAAVCPATAVARDAYPQGLAELAAPWKPGPWLYTGALENHPELVDAIAKQRPLWGNPGPVLRRVRDPIAWSEALHGAGVAVPEARLDADGLPRDGSWLVKPRRSAGGQWIDSLEGRPAAVAPLQNPRARAVYFQQRIIGLSHSAVFIAKQSGAELVGVTRQWHGQPGAPFAYAGSAGPCAVGLRVERRLVLIGQVLASAFGLTGLFGVDFILHAETPWPVEVNPRYTASVEVLELARGRPLLAEHCQVYAPSLPTSARDHRQATSAAGRVVGKLVLHAQRQCTFPGSPARTFKSGSPFQVPQIGDVPAPGAVFEPGDPVLTLFAIGESVGSCRARLRRARVRWLRLLRDAVA
jgi:predicted ATP-grasp superfamily ATP-dependent carboligase